MNHIDITVIVTVYNQSLLEVKKTLLSIKNQSGCDYQVIIGDDGSEEDITPEIIELCNKLDFAHFEVVRHEKNLKTVGNVLSCLEKAHGKYVKLVGSGDQLYPQSALKNIVDFCDRNNLKAGFGDIIIEHTNNVFNAPRNKGDYKLNAEMDTSKILHHALLQADWIPGGAQFYETGYFIQLLSTLHDYCGVLYCEDLAHILALDQCPLRYMEEPVLIYDVSGGISTSGSNAAVRRMYDDHFSFYSKMKDVRLHGLSLSKEYYWFRVRRFIALRTPLYALIKRVNIGRLTKSNS